MTVSGPKVLSVVIPVWRAVDEEVVKESSPPGFFRMNSSYVQQVWVER